MKKVFIIGALALGMMSFSEKETIALEEQNWHCWNYANQATAWESSVFGFESTMEESLAWVEWYTQCVSL